MHSQTTQSPLARASPPPAGSGAGHSDIATTTGSVEMIVTRPLCAPQVRNEFEKKVGTSGRRSLYPGTGSEFIWEALAEKSSAYSLPRYEHILGWSSQGESWGNKYIERNNSL